MSKDKSLSKKEGRKVSVLRILLVSYLVVVVMLAAVIYIVPRFSTMFDETYIAEYGTVNLGYKCTALVVRNEQIHTAEGTGVLERLVPEDTVMRKNSKIVDVSGTGYYSQVRGTVSYYFDGLEDELTPDTMEEISLDYLTQFEQIDKNESKGKKDEPEPESVSGFEYKLSEVGNEVKRGDCIFKIVDNQAWYLVCWLTQAQVKSLDGIVNVKVAFSDDEGEYDTDEAVRMKIHFIGEDIVDGKRKVILSCNRIYEGYLFDRVVDCDIIVKSKSGIILKTSSLVEEDGQTGVMRKNKYGEDVFVPVKILLQDEEDHSVAEVKENGYYSDEDGNLVATVKNYDTIKIGSERNVD